MEPNNPQLQKESTDNGEYMLEIEESVIIVNDHTMMGKSNPVQSELTFQLLNPVRAHQIMFNNPDRLSADQMMQQLQNGEKVSGASYICFYFPYGEQAEDFIDMERAQLMSFETENSDWTVSKGVIDQDQISFVVSCYDQTVISTLFSLSFYCQNIQSYAPPGQTYVYVKIQNVIGIPDITKVFPIQKIPIQPYIHQFYSPQTTFGTNNDQLTLKWKISGADRGKLSPGEVDILSLKTSTVNIPADQTQQYRLSLQGGVYGAEAYVNVYKHPPVVQKLEYDPVAQQVIWQTKYSHAVQMKVDRTPVTLNTTQTDLPASGATGIELSGKSQVVLRARGYLYDELVGISLTGYGLGQNYSFSSWIRKYEKYTHTCWRWKTEPNVNVTLQFTEDATVWYPPHQVDHQGEFQYVSVHPIVGAKLGIRATDGNGYTELCLDREAEEWGV